MSGTFLVIDDSRLHHQMYQLIFRRSAYSSATLLHAYDGRQGYDLFRAHPEIALVFLDLNMPVMNGLQFLHLRREEGLHLHVPVTLVTTESTAEDEARGLEAGAWGYLCKPFRPEDLLALVARAERRTSTALPR